MDMRFRVRELREDGDIPQKAIAQYLKCDQSSYSKMERGVRSLPLEYAVKLAEFYKTSVDYLVGLTDERTPYPRSRRK